MRTFLILGLGAVVSLPALGIAGVYNPDLQELAKSPKLSKELKEALTDELMEPSVNDKEVTPLPYIRFRLALEPQMEIPDTVRNTPRRQRYLQRTEELRKKVESDPDNVTDRVSLSAYLIRFGQVDQAVQLLEGLARGPGRNNFMAAANLATAYLLMGDAQSLQLADDYLRQALSNWPSEWPGLSKEQLAWYKEAEQAQLKLIRVRRKELAAHGGKARPPETVDDLFGVKFVGDSGNYEAGSLAAAEKQKLPKNALASTEQLLLWMPGDARLYWLFGELLNAQGDIDNAKKVLDQCADSRRLNAVELRQHRQVLDEALAARNQGGDGTSTSWLPDAKRIILVSGGVGAVILLLAYLQIRQLRRHKQGGWL